MIEKENRIMKLFHLMILLKLFRGVILTQNTTMCPFADDVAGDSQCRAVVDKDFSSLCADHGYVAERCCYQNGTWDVLVGLDVRKCDIEHSHQIQQLSLENLGSIQLLLMDDNPFSKVNQEDFLGMTRLDLLKLPEGCHCPGEKEAWKNITYSNTKFDQNTECEGQIPITDANCPDNSITEPYGPSLFQCLCKPEFTGYRCLRSVNKFPWKMFGPIIAVATILISTLLLWKKHGHDSIRHMKVNLNARFMG
ncbi:all-trans retinoic acid-induced differentiation factor-like isoform X2 [Convolutriloba macropyga]|uniref:all-trans retinoic acid-induced differentiation factor-like isoform X2 n=1 Tax=Convolutriloba macropyga TaxID=536237 RepID=UPI003F51C5CB